MSIEPYQWFNVTTNPPVPTLNYWRIKA